MSFDATNKGVVYANLGLNSVALGSTAYSSAVTAATADGLRAYSNALVSAEQAALTDSDFATAVMANLGMTAAVIGQAAYDALQPALAAYVNAVGVANRGVVVVQLADIVAGLTADATFGAAATNLNNAAATAYVYSTNAANTDAKIIDVPTATAPSSTFTLTTSATDNLVGTEFADIFTGVTSSLTSAATLQETDKIDGGAGQDVFKLDMNTTFTGFTSGSITNVETIELINKSATARKFDAKGVTGASKYVLYAATGSIDELSNVGTGFKTLEIHDQKTGTFKSSFGSGAAELAGTADALALTFKDVGTSTSSRLTLNLGSFETVNVVAAGTSNFVSFASSSSLESLAISGSGRLNVVAGKDGVKTFDASAATGAITADLSAVTTASTLTSVSGGSGADSFTVNAAGVRANATFAGGAGEDVLKYTSTSGGTVEYAMTGIETLTLDKVTGALNFSGGKTSGLTKIGTDKETTHAVDFLNMGAADLTFTASGTTVAGGEVKSDHTGSTTVSYSATSTQVSNKTAALPDADYTFANSASALTVNVGAYVDTTNSTISAAKATSVNVTVASGKNASNAEVTAFNSKITAASATSISVNATGKLGADAEVDAAKATSATIVNGETSGSLKLATAKLTSLNVTSSSGFEVLPSVATSLDALESLTVTANAGQTTLGNLKKLATANLSGAGASSAVKLGNLGDTTNAQNLSITASGLKGTAVSPDNYTYGLEVGNLVVGAGYDVTVTANAMAGNVKFGNVAGASPNQAKNVTINAAGGKGTFDIGVIQATGTVNLDVSGTTKAVTLGAITAKDITVNAAGGKSILGVGAISGGATGTVNVDASNTTGVASLSTVEGKSVTVNLDGAAATSTVGKITAVDSVNVTYNALTANTGKEIDAATTSTALNVVLKGGILQDTITIKGAAGQKSITVTGDLGASTTDKLTVNGAAATGAQTINISGLTNYDESAITGGSAADTIVGGAGKDTIKGGAGADILTGGAGTDTFVFNAGHSTILAMDTITDLQKIDTIVYEGQNTAKAADVSATAGKAAVTNGVATFDHIAASSKDTLAKVVGLVDEALDSNANGKTVVFTFDGSTYLFINDDAVANDTVIKLVGVNVNDLGDWAFALPNGNDTGMTGIGG